ncbi:MAG TPA: fatty acid desaturase [Thermoanaerobaculia bacterium]|nr:fatty acid desaturase [Thermoanaerobaculia bacterium]
MSSPIISAASAAASSHEPVRPRAQSLPRDVFQKLLRLNPWRWCFALAVDWALVAMAIVAAGWIDRWYGYAGALLLIGRSQHAIVVLGHEGAHRVISRRRRLNDWLTQVFCFWPMGTDMHTYRDFHFPHHRHLNTPIDPEMKYREMGAPGWDVPRARWQVGLRFAADLAGLGALEMYRIFRFTQPRTWRAAAGPLALHGAVLLACGLAGAWWIPALWWGAGFTSFAAVWRFRCWMEHLGTEDTHRLHLTPLQAWLFAPRNIWLHWEHHHWPGVPYWNLPALRKLTPGEPVVRLGELFRYYERCARIASGAPILDDEGRPAVDLARRLEERPAWRIH